MENTKNYGEIEIVVHLKWSIFWIRWKFLFLFSLLKKKHLNSKISVFLYELLSKEEVLHIIILGDRLLLFIVLSPPWVWIQKLISKWNSVKKIYESTPTQVIFPPSLPYFWTTLLRAESVERRLWSVSISENLWIFSS